MKAYVSSIGHHCTHTGPTRLFQVGKATLWAGSATELSEHAGLVAVISAVGYTKFVRNPLSGNDGARALFPETLFAWTPPACIGIDWPDGGVPALSGAWWEHLYNALRRGIDGDVGLCCFGGHGRTGVMASILAVRAGVVPKKKACPVTWLRKVYCNAAVESVAQVDYVQRITGRTVRARASRAVADVQRQWWDPGPVDRVEAVE